jgi:hypothetical protein
MIMLALSICEKEARAPENELTWSKVSEIFCNPLEMGFCEYSRNILSRSPWKASGVPDTASSSSEFKRMLTGHARRRSLRRTRKRVLQNSEPFCGVDCVAIFVALPIGLPWVRLLRKYATLEQR